MEDTLKLSFLNVSGLIQSRTRTILLYYILNYVNAIIVLATYLLALHVMPTMVSPPHQCRL